MTFMANVRNQYCLIRVELQLRKNIRILSFKNEVVNLTDVTVCINKNKFTFCVLIKAIKNK